MDIAPVVEPVIVTLQLPEASVHVPPGVKVTVPVGVITVPGDVSVTAAVHVVVCPTIIVDGVHVTLVVVVRRVTVMLVLPAEAE